MKTHYAEQTWKLFYLQISAICRLLPPCCKQKADMFHRRTNKMIKAVPRSDITVRRQCIDITENWNEQLIQKVLKKPPIFNIHEITDFSGESHLMVYCRFIDLQVHKIVEHHFFCQTGGNSATAVVNFKQNQWVRVTEGCDKTSKTTNA